MKEYLKIGFMNPQKLTDARRMTRKQVIGFFSILALILTFSMTSMLINVLTTLQEDSSEIAAQIPEFTITDSQLVVADDQESYVHQTNSFLFFFDPNGSIETAEIDANLNRLNVPIGIGLMQDEFYLNITGRSIPLNYDQLDGFTDNALVTLMNQIGNLSPLVLIFVFITAYLASSFSLLYDWLILALFTNILVTLLRLNIPFKKNARMALVSLSIPTLALSLVEAFGYFVPFSFELKLGFSIYFLYTSLKIIAPKKKKDE